MAGKNVTMDPIELSVTEKEQVKSAIATLKMMVKKYARQDKDHYLNPREFKRSTFGTAAQELEEELK